MEEELATIVEVVRYLYERCATADMQTATSELRELVENAAQTAMLARELSTVRVVDFDSAVLERGRPTPDELIASTKVRVASGEPGDARDDGRLAPASGPGGWLNSGWQASTRCGAFRPASVAPPKRSRGSRTQP